MNLADRLEAFYGPAEETTRCALVAAAYAVGGMATDPLDQAERLDRLATALNRAAIELRLAHAAEFIES